MKLGERTFEFPAFEFQPYPLKCFSKPLYLIMCSFDHQFLKYFHYFCQLFMFPLDILVKKVLKMILFTVVALACPRKMTIVKKS